MKHFYVYTKDHVIYRTSFITPSDTGAALIFTDLDTDKKVTLPWSNFDYISTTC